MSKYKVTVTIHDELTEIVEANSNDEAIEKVDNMLAEGKLVMTIDSQNHWDCFKIKARKIYEKGEK